MCVGHVCGLWPSTTGGRDALTACAPHVTYHRRRQQVSCRPVLEQGDHCDGTNHRDPNLEEIVEIG
jgi:hypothetical protein